MGTYEQGDVGDARGLRVATVVARFNQHVTSLLEDGAVATLREHGIVGDDAPVLRVPGAFELPIVAKRLAESGECDAVISLGAVIRGDTPHFDYVCDAVTRGIGDAVRTYKIPIGFGVLTTDDVQQAMARAGTKDANKGYEALLTAVEMVHVMRGIS